MACAPATVAAYLRVSNQVQRQRETIASQREAVLHHARRCGGAIPDAYVFADDGFSGATLERPALEALRDGVASGEIETVLVWSIDRLSRNFAHQILLQEEFARTGAKIVCVQEPDDATPQGMLLRQILSVISEYERTLIAERSRRGKIHRARQGSLNMLTRAPYGYRLIRKTETCGARLEVDETEARVVRRIYELYVRDGLKMHEIGPRLDAQGARPRHAQHWSSSTVSVILRNEAYVGKAAYLKTMSSGKRARRNRTGRQNGGAVRRLTGRTRCSARERRLDRAARSRHRGRGTVRACAATTGGQPALLCAQDHRADASARTMCLRALWIHHGTQLRGEDKPQDPAPTLLSMPRDRRLAPSTGSRVR